MTSHGHVETVVPVAAAQEFLCFRLQKRAQQTDTREPMMRKSEN
jgi:hypothetical protein